MITDIKFKALTDTLKVSKVDDATYFSKQYSHYVSNSRLSNINPEQGGTPDKFFGSMPPLYSDSLILGSAVHGMYLQPDYFELVRCSRPTAKLGFVCDYIYDHAPNHEIKNRDIIIEASDRIEYFKGKMTDAKIAAVREAYEPYKAERMSFKATEGKEPMFLSEGIYDKAMSCIEACNKNEAFTKILHPQAITNPITENELCFTMDIECDFPDRLPIILHFKAKLDNFTIDFDSNTIVVNDLKTIGSVLSNFDWKNNGNMKRFHYHRELGIYLYLLKLYVEKEYNMINPTMQVNCLVVSTIPEYYTKVYRVTNAEVQAGFKEFKNLLHLVAYYKGYQGYDFG